MEPTIYKPSIYKGAGIYKAEGGGGFFPIELKTIQGSRSTPIYLIPWPDTIDTTNIRVTTQVLYFDVGTKIRFTCNKQFSIIDGTTNNMPFFSSLWIDGSFDYVVEYGVITISVRNPDNSQINPQDVEIKISGY